MIKTSLLWGWWDAEQLPRGVVDAPILAAFKAQLDKALVIPVYGRCPCPWQRVGTGWSLRSVQPFTFCDPVIKRKAVCVGLFAHEHGPSWAGAVPQPAPPSCGMKSLPPAEAASPAQALLNACSHKAFPMRFILLIEDNIAHLRIPKATFSPLIWAFWGKCTTQSRKLFALACLRDDKGITIKTTIYIREMEYVTIMLLHSFAYHIYPM